MCVWPRALPPLLRLRDGGDEVGAAARFDDAIGRLAVGVEFPVLGRIGVRGVQDRALEELVGHVGRPASSRCVVFCCSIHRSMSCRLNLHWPRTLKAGISAFCAIVYTVLSATFSNVATSGNVRNLVRHELPFLDNEDQRMPDLAGLCQRRLRGQRLDFSNTGTAYVGGAVSPPPPGDAG